VVGVFFNHSLLDSAFEEVREYFGYLAKKAPTKEPKEDASLKVNFPSPLHLFIRA